MHINIPYGANGIYFSIPDKNVWQVLFPQMEKSMASIESSLIESLNSPVGSGKISEIIAKKGSAGDLKTVIICDDITRQTPQKRILDILIPCLEELGLCLSNMKIIIATGTNRHMRGDEIYKRFGSWVSPVLTENHDEENNTSLIGKTSSGIEVYLNKDVVKADIKIAVGSIDPYPISGFTGGSNLVLPGITGRETIDKYFRLYALGTGTSVGSIDNPIRALSDEAAELLGLDFTVNIVLNAANGICGICCGSYKEAFTEAAKLARNLMGVRIRPETNLVIAGSYPADLDLWQAKDALLNASKLTQEQSRIILIAPCLEGISPKHERFCEYIGMDQEKLGTSILKGTIADVPAAAVALRLKKLLKNIEVCLISEGISVKDIQKMGFTPFGDIYGALDYCGEKLGGDLKISIVPYAGKIYPYFESEEQDAAETRTQWL